MEIKMKTGMLFLTILVAVGCQTISSKSFVGQMRATCQLSGCQSVVWGVCEPNEPAGKQAVWFAWFDPRDQGTLNFVLNCEIEALGNVEMRLVSVIESAERRAIASEDPRVIHVTEGFSVNNQQWLLPGEKATWFFLRGKDFSRQFLDRVRQGLLAQHAMRSWEVKGSLLAK